MDETEKCVASILGCNFLNYEIVIVDNGSADGSAQKMHDLYDDNKFIHVVESKENVGFSKGNNLGYQFIRDNIDADFVVVTNNDVLFPQKDFDQRIAEVYRDTQFHILGPDIFVRAKKIHQSPLTLNMPTLFQIKKELAMYEYYERHPQKWVRRRTLQNIKNRFCQKFKCFGWLCSLFKGGDTINPLKAYKDCCVQGACIIISKKFLKSEKKMFSPEPFLFCEEMLLYKKCKEKKYKIVYEPSIQIWHEDSSTMKIVNKNNLGKAQFTLKHHVRARRMLVEVWESTNGADV